MFKDRRLVIFITLFLCAFIILIAHFQFFQAREITVKLYSEKQIVLAKQVALSIEKFFTERISALELLAESFAIQQINRSNYVAKFEDIYWKIGFYKYLLFINKEGKIIDAYPSEKNQNLADKFPQRFSIIKKYANPAFPEKSVICDYGLINTEEGLICISVPVFDLTGQFVGIIFGGIELDSSLSSLVTPTIEELGVHIFIMSEKGNVLYHPNHPEMMRHNIMEPGGYCRSCHVDITLEKRMIIEDSGWGEKYDHDGDRWLISFAKIQLPGTRWSLAIGMPYRLITESNSRQFQIFFLLSGAMALVILLGGIALYRINKERVAFQKKQEDSRREHLAFIGEMSTRIAHEIKNPLASLQTGIQLLESNLPENTATKEYFSRLTGEVERVDRIVKGLLTYAGEEHLQKKATNLAELAQRVVDLNRQSSNDKQITWRVNSNGTDVVATVDAQRIEQVLWNLIINAMHAISDSGDITIEVIGDAKGMVNLIVADNGSGIPSHVLEKLFKPFFSTKSQGTGLGLAISKKIIEAHGGSITITSEAGQGTEVTISLPR